MGEAIRTIIVDDEEPARERLRKLLHPYPDIRIVAEAQDGEEALETILKVKPDLVFLDIQMPGCSGLEVMASLPSPLPRIIFCTAYDQYAIEAFELHAVDYLLKPVSRDRLARSLEHLQSLPDPEARLRQAGQDLQPGATRFLAKKANRFHVIPAGDVLFFESQEGLTRLHTGQDGYWMDPSLTELEGRLAHGQFYRISRQVIINLDAVKEVVPLLGGFGEIRLKDGTRLQVSRRRMRELLQRLESGSHH